MEDPLDSFDWSTLYARYDKACVRFDASSPHLLRFDESRPQCDRALYYRLIDAYSPAKRPRETNPLGLFKALLYWKLYSQKTTPHSFKRWSVEGGGFDHAKTALPKMLADLPVSLERDVDTVVELVQSLTRYEMPGMIDKKTIPVRSTLLHFIYPSTVPIFDRMVLQAVGECRKDAKNNIDVFREYLPFAWKLADKHAKRASVGHTETALRLLDMALWVDRGKN